MISIITSTLLVDTWAGFIFLNLAVALALATATVYMFWKPSADRRVALTFGLFQIELALWTSPAPQSRHA